MADWYSTITEDGADDNEEAFRWTHDRIQNARAALPFVSRRSPILAKHGAVATSQPLASNIGLHVLQTLNGNAADAAVAIAAALAVLEPCSTGLGGDMFALYYSARDRKVHAVNGSGRSPMGLTLDVLQRDCPLDNNNNNKGNKKISSQKFQFSPHSITVPGAARGWEDMFQRFGSRNVTFAELLEPAAKLAEEGFPVSPITAQSWSSGMNQIKQWITTANKHDKEKEQQQQQQHVPLSVDGKRGPHPGEIMHNPDMARVLRTLGRYGATRGFYDNESVGGEIVAVIQKHGGTMTMDDLRNHATSTFPEPIGVEYRGVKLWQVPPNGQGVAGLVALSGLNELEKCGVCDPITPREMTPAKSADVWHVMIEMMRLGFDDARRYVADPDYVTTDDKQDKETHVTNKNKTGTNEWLLDQERIRERACKEFQKEKAVIHGEPLPSSCTVSFQVVDKEGNAVSFVNSNYKGFGTGTVPKNCGFTLQNRGYGFNIHDPIHPNALQPNKRPYHTIIPGMLTHADTGELYATLSNMGGFMQPQGHFQLTVGMVAGGLDPQAAIDMPRFCIADGTRGGVVQLEDGITEEVIETLRKWGHKMNPNVSGYSRSVFGRAQIIKRDRTTGVLWAGSDGRADGCAMGY